MSTPIKPAHTSRSRTSSGGRKFPGFPLSHYPRGLLVSWFLTLYISPACLGRRRVIQGTLFYLASFTEQYVHEIQAGCCVELHIIHCHCYVTSHCMNYAMTDWPLCYLLMSSWVVFSLGLLR